MDKKKMHFWQLTIIFGSITLLALIYSYINYQGNQAEMMADSMAKMMGMHLDNVAVSDLISRQEDVAASAQNLTSEQDMSSHHSETNSYTNAIHLIATATIVILLPFIIAGTVFLAIIWLE